MIRPLLFTLSVGQSGKGPAGLEYGNVVYRFTFKKKEQHNLGLSRGAVTGGAQVGPGWTLCNFSIFRGTFSVRRSKARPRPASLSPGPPGTPWPVGPHNVNTSAGTRGGGGGRGSVVVSSQTPSAEHTAQVGVWAQWVAEWTGSMVGAGGEASQGQVLP